MKKILLMIALILFSISMFSQTKQRESYYQDKFAKIVGGETEVVLSDGTRADIVTDKYAIEVDFGTKWAESIGQSLSYAIQLEKKAGVLLVISGEDEIRFLDRLMAVAVEHGIQVWIWNWMDDTWSKVDYKITYLY
jgi:hypothetical protein